MIQIKYPINTIQEKKVFSHKYYNIIKDHIDEDLINDELRIIRFKNKNLNLKTLLTLSFEELLNLYIQHDINLDVANVTSHFKYLENNKISYLYDKIQLPISKFFMDSLKIKTCYYCNIEFVNVFNQIRNFDDIFDFLNNANNCELEIILGENKSEKILNARNNQVLKREDLLNINGFAEKTVDKIVKTDIKSLKNHFTLDHFLAKSNFPYFSLSLFNFVPSCYSCNCKFKGDKSFSGDHLALSRISPTSNEFVLDKEIEFILKYDVSKKNNSLDDINVDLINISKNVLNEDFINMFNLRGRYEFHKNEALTLINKNNNYSTAQLEEFKTILEKDGVERDVEKIKQDIFGNYISKLSSNNEPLTKYKKDIARQLGLI